MGTLDAQIIADVVRRCIGHTDITGDKAHDEQSRKNVNKYLELIDILLGDIHTLMDNVDSDNMNEMLISCRSVGFLAKCRTVIGEWLKESRNKLSNNG